MTAGTKTSAARKYNIYLNEPNRAAIAERERKNGEAAEFIMKSLKGACNPAVEEFARKKGIKLDWGNIINRIRQINTDYINAEDFRPPPQCKDVLEASRLQAEWEAHNLAIKQVQNQISASLSASTKNYETMSLQKSAGLSGTYRNAKEILRSGESWA
jgi:hypothetical protein